MKIEKFIEEMDEWDTVFDPTDKPEYSHAQLVRFAELWAKKQKKCTCGQDVKMSTPKGVEFNTAYVMDHTFHSDHYWDVNRNIDVTVSDGQAYIVPFDQQLDQIIKKVTDLLKKKNKAYGNSALDPTNIFSKTNATDSLCARIDDKLARIKNKGINDKTEDTVDDLIGYLLLLKMSL